MKQRSRILVLIGVLVVSAIVAYTFNPGEKATVAEDKIDDTSTTETVVATADFDVVKLVEERMNKERFFTESVDSPLLSADKDEFEGLAYYPPNARFSVEATIEKTVKPLVMEIATTDGKIDKYGKYGYANFDLDGETHRLLLLEPIGFPYLFVAFNDLTNGLTTYGGGRYFEVPKPKGNKLTLDFNRAYNPYCAYNKKYSCPIPPRENRLEIEIKAGEKAFDDH